MENTEQIQQPIDKLHQSLVKDKLYTKSKDEFAKQFSSIESVDKLYNSLHESKRYTKTKDEFYNRFFSNIKTKKEESKPSEADITKNKTKEPESIPIEKPIDKKTGKPFPTVFESLFGNPQQEKSVSESTAKPKQDTPKKLMDRLPYLRDQKAKQIAEQNVAKEGHLPFSNAYYEELAKVKKELPFEAYAPSFLLLPNKEQQKESAIKEYAKVTGEAPEMINQKINENIYTIDDGKIKQYGDGEELFSQGVHDYIQNFNLGCQIAAFEAEGNRNGIKYAMNNYMEEKKKQKEFASADLSGSMIEGAGGMVPFVVSSVLPGLSEVSMGFSNMASQSMAIWNDPNKSDDEKAALIGSGMSDNTMVGITQGVIFNNLGSLSEKTSASDLLKSFAPTSKLKYNLGEKLDRIYRDILKPSPSHIAKAAAIGAGTEIVNQFGRMNEGIKTDWRGIPKAGLDIALLELTMKGAHVIGHGLGVIKSAVSSKYNKLNPEWFNSYSHDVQTALNNIVKAPEPIYQIMLKSLDNTKTDGAAEAKAHIETFRQHRNSLPETMTDAMKDKALHIIQLRNESLHQAELSTDIAIKKYYEKRAESYNGLLEKAIETNLDLNKEPLTEFRFAAQVKREEEENKKQEEQKLEVTQEGSPENWKIKKDNGDGTVVVTKENGSEITINKSELEKEISYSEEHKIADENIAKGYGFENQYEALNSIEKRTGTKYEKFSDVPKDVLEKVQKEREAEKITPEEIKLSQETTDEVRAATLEQLNKEDETRTSDGGATKATFEPPKEILSTIEGESRELPKPEQEHIKQSVEKLGGEESARKQFESEGLDEYGEPFEVFLSRKGC